MASIRKAKKLGIYKAIPYSKERARLIAETRASVEKANKRLKSLNNAGYKGTWASKKLIDRLDKKNIRAIDKTGKIKINKQMTNTQLKAIQKASDQFLKSKTSTPKGIRDVKSSTIKALQSTLSNEERGKVTEDDAEFYYDMFGSDDFNYFADKLGASTLWSLIDDSIEHLDSEESWIKRLEGYITLNDLDMRERAIRLYEKYIILLGGR